MLNLLIQGSEFVKMCCKQAECTDSGCNVSDRNENGMMPANDKLTLIWPKLNQSHRR